MNRKFMMGIAVASLLGLVSIYTTNTFSHCQMPCGIYDDDLRFKLMEEQLTTIEKAMKQITELSTATPEKNYNQIVRWVQDKDSQADDFSEIVTQYFLTQRIKPVEETDKAGYEGYTKKLVQLHQMSVFAMKCKQTTDEANVQKLHKLLDDFKAAYTAK